MPLIADFPHFLHGGDYNADQWWADYPEVITEDFALMPQAGCNAFSLAIFGWASLEPSEGVYTFDWLDDIMDRMAAAGHKVLLATPAAGKPNWLGEHYPEVRRVLPDGRREPQGKRANHCPSSPVFLQKITALSEALAQRYGKHPALGLWHIDNEVGGEAPDCHCDLCYENFRKWLRRRYGSLEALNKAWWSSFWSHTYTDWSQVRPSDGANEPCELDWRRFITDMRLQGVEAQVAAIRKFSDIPTTTNLMGAHQTLDYRRILSAVDIVANDTYPEWTGDDRQWRVAAWLSFCGDLMRGLGNGQPWIQMEACPSSTNWQQFHRLKRPGVFRREMFQAVAHGAEASLYFQWRKSRGGGEKFHGAVVDHDSGNHPRVFQEVAAWGKDLKKIQPLIDSRITADVALIYDWQVRWACEFSQGPGGGFGSDEFTFLAGQDQGHWHRVSRYYRALWRASISTDIKTLDDDLSTYRAVILPHTFMVSEQQAERLRNYVAQGGMVLGTTMTGMVNENMLVHRGGLPGAGLSELFGIIAEEVDTLRPSDQQHLAPSHDNSLGLKEHLVAGPYCELLRLNGASPMATYRDDFYAGSPALTQHAFGQGQAWWLACDLDEEGTATVIQALTSQAGIDGVLPPNQDLGVQATQRVSPDGTNYLCLANHHDQPATCRLPPGQFHDLLSDQTVEGNLDLTGNAIMVLQQR